MIDIGGSSRKIWATYDKPPCSYQYIHHLSFGRNRGTQASVVTFQSTIGLLKWGDNWHCHFWDDSPGTCETRREVTRQHREQGQGVREGSPQAEFGFKLIKKHTSTLRFLVEFLWNNLNYLTKQKNTKKYIRKKNPKQTPNPQDLNVTNAEKSQAHRIHIPVSLAPFWPIKGRQDGRWSTALLAGFVSNFLHLLCK